MTVNHSHSSAQEELLSPPVSVFRVVDLPGLIKKLISFD